VGVERATKAGDDVTKPIRVGIIGASPSRGWALAAHLPALAALPDFEVTAVSTTRLASANETAQRFGVPRAFDDAAALANSDDVDLVVVSVKVPHHFELTKTVIAAGKDVFTEWPLGANRAQAEQLQALATAAGVRHVIGLQGRKSPIANYLRHLVEEGYVGTVRSATSWVSYGGFGGPIIAPDRAWVLDRANGATLLSIIAGHTLDTLRYTVGEFTELRGLVTTLVPQATVEGTDEVVAVTSPDQVLLHGRTETGAVIGAGFFSAPRGEVSRWSILGDTGSLTVAGNGLVHFADHGLRVFGSRGGADPEELEVPASFQLAPPEVAEGPARNVASLYRSIAGSLGGGRDAVPDFTTAVDLHGLLDGIELSSEHGDVRHL
jgi:predicted dehydrogenase